MEILEGFELTGSLRDATELAGCLPNTVARLCSRSGGWGHWCPVGWRVDRAGSKSSWPSWRISWTSPRVWSAPMCPGQDHCDGVRRVWTDHPSRGRGDQGAWRTGRRRGAPAWIPEPGMWAQYDFGDGPHVRDPPTILVLLLVGLVPVPSRVTAVGQDRTERVRRDRRHAARRGWGSDVSTDRRPTFAYPPAAEIDLHADFVAHASRLGFHGVRD
jgi:hypothetical protein